MKTSKFLHLASVITCLKCVGNFTVVVILCLLVLSSLASAAPIPGSLIVTSDPTGARVFLDGAYKGTTTYADKIDPGHYTLKLTYPGYLSYETTITMLSNEATSIDAVLVKVPTTGTLKVSSTPSGAKVYVNGLYEGNTPFSDELDPGTYEIKVTMTGHSDHDATATIVAGAETILSFWMYPVETSGKLAVSSVPTGATVYVDGIFTGTTPLAETTEAGIHIVIVNMAGYNDHISSVIVPAGGGASVSAILTKTTATPSTTVSTVTTSTSAPSSIRTGSYVIMSTPDDASVYLDGSMVGVTPYRTGELSEGQHSVILRLSGYHDYATVINVAADTEGMVDVDMASTGGTKMAPTYAMPGFGWVIAAGALLIVMCAGFRLNK